MSEPSEALRVEGCPKWVRAYLGGEPVVDSRDARLVWEQPYYPTYYFPAADVAAVLKPTGEVADDATRGRAQVCDVATARLIAAGAALHYVGAEAAGPLRDLVRLDWSAMDAWFEEDEPVYTHARDPYTRVDVLTSSRHVRIDLDGTTLAESHAPRILFETRLPVRYYLPMTDVDQRLLRPSEATTRCPYKGEANYFSVEVDGRLHRNLIWVYRSPLPESQKIAGMAGFYTERTELWVDGVRQDGPRNPFA
jgi:uncharacterized protein (DUF427 family)